VNSDEAGPSVLDRVRARGADAVAWTRRAARAFADDGARVLTRPIREGLLVALSVAVIIWVFKLFNNDFLYEGIGFDESHFVWCGWCILKGLIPYRDFLEFKPPIPFLTHALALAIHGYKDFHFRWFFFYFPLLSLLSLYFALLTRKIDKVAALALVLGIIYLWVNHEFHDSALSDTESIGLTYYFFGVACLIARSRFGYNLKGLGVALLLCCAFSKEPFMPAVFFTCVSCFFLDVNWETWRADAKRYFKASLIGGGVFGALMCLYLVPTGGMTQYIKMVRSYARIYRDPQHAYCVMFGRFTPVDTVSDLRAQFKEIRAEFLNVGKLGYLLPFAALYPIFVVRRSKLLALAGLLTLVGALWAFTASKCQWPHYYNMTMSGLFFVLVLGVDSMNRRLSSFRANRVAGWLLFASVFVVVWPRFDKETNRHDVRHFANAYAEPIPGVLEFIEKNTTPQDRIFTTGAPALYVQANRLSAVRESAIVDYVIYGYPGNTDEERLSGLKEQLERNMPKVVVIEPVYESSRQIHMDVLIKPFLERHAYKAISDRIWLRPN
jgi:hypothetical protein